MGYRVNEEIDKAIRNSGYGTDRDGFARRVGMNHAVLNGLLTGSCELTPEMKKQWAALTGMTEAELFA